MTDEQAQTIAAFHRLYYEHVDRTWKNTRWLGVPLQKCPLDLWNYQEIVYEVRPDVLIESGSWLGGSALYFASLCDLVQHGRVLTIDTDAVSSLGPLHPRITYLQGSSLAQDIVLRVRQAIGPEDRVMVVLDSDHSAPHVLGELRAYGPLVTLNSYLIVEDTNVNGRPVLPGFGPGPHEALEAFLGETPAFARDPAREKFFMTFNPGGYVKRIRP